MKKVFLLAIVFLFGITAQATTNNQENVVTNPGKKYRYNNSQEIKFVENGVLYFVSKDGYFDFIIIDESQLYNRGRNNHKTKYHKRRNYFKPQIRMDRYGKIYSIGSTQIKYQRNGKVKSIGTVPLEYFRGRLTQVGFMQITYNRFGDIRDTIGYINRFNESDWHDDWYSYNDDSDDDDRSKRYRKRK
jgi:hypothetical protein